MNEPSVNVGQELVSRLKALNDRLEAEAARLRLTDAEREAVEWASKKMRLLGDAYDPERAAILRGLLERTR